MPQNPVPFKVRDLRRKEKSFIDDDYINGWAKHLRPAATAVYISLCRHADKEQQCFPATKLIAEEHGITRRTVQEKTRLLEKWNIIKKKRVRKKSGTWLNTTYFLLDKTEWHKPPWEKTSHSPTMGKKQHHHGKSFPTKVTHIKDTHISINNTKRITSTEYGNKDVNSLLTHLKEKLNLPMLDGSDKENRRYCWLAIKKFGGVDKVRALVDTASQDKFWSTNLASFKKLYYNGVSIISKTKIFKDRRPQKQVIITSARPTPVESELARRKLAEMKEKTR